MTTRLPSGARRLGVLEAQKHPRIGLVPRPGVHKVVCKHENLLARPQRFDER